MCLNVRLAAGRIAAQANFLRRKRRSPSAQDALQDGWLFLGIQGVELLHDIDQLDVLFEAGLLFVRLIALWTPKNAHVFGPGLANAAVAEVVLTRQLHGVHKHMQADGTDELLLETVLPGLGHLSCLGRRHAGQFYS